MTFAILTFAYVFSQFYRSFLSVIASDLMADLSIGPAEFGQLGAVWFFVFALAQFAVGFCLDRFGPRRTMVAFMIFAVVGAILFARAPDFATARLAMGLNGLGCAAILMGSYFLFARQAPERFARLSSLLLAVGLIGNLASTTPLALLAASFGWRMAILFIAAGTALALVLVALFVQDPPRATAQSSAAGSIGAEMLAVFRIGALWPIMAISFGANVIVQTERGLWIGPFLQAVHGLSLTERGNGALAMAAAMAAGAIAFAAWPKRLESAIKPLILVTSAGMSLAFAGLSLVPANSPAPAIALAALAGALGMTFALQMAHARLFLPAHLTGRGMTLVNFAAIGGTALVQWISGLAVQGLEVAGQAPAQVYSILHAGFAVVGGVATAIYLFAPRRPRAL